VAFTQARTPGVRASGFVAHNAIDPQQLTGFAPHG
jgi:hypothetical protein